MGILEYSTIAGGLLGAISLWITLYLHNQTNKTSSKMEKSLDDIKIQTLKMGELHSKIIESYFTLVDDFIRSEKLPRKLPQDTLMDNKNDNINIPISTILNGVYKNKKRIIADDLIQEARKNGIGFNEVIRELIELKEKEVISFVEPFNALTEIVKK